MLQLVNKKVNYDYICFCHIITGRFNPDHLMINRLHIYKP